MIGGRELPAKKEENGQKEGQEEVLNSPAGMQITQLEEKAKGGVQKS